MEKINIGDRVRIKERNDWPTPPGYKLANSKGVVSKWCEWQGVMDDFQDFALVQIEESDAKEYIGTKVYIRVENLVKI